MHPLETLWQYQQIENTIGLNRFSPHAESHKQKCHCIKKTLSSYAHILGARGYKINTITCPNQPNAQSLLQLENLHPCLGPSSSTRSYILPSPAWLG
jgi:hypothetical protein